MNNIWILTSVWVIVTALATTGVYIGINRWNVRDNKATTARKTAVLWASLTALAHVLAVIPSPLATLAGQWGAVVSWVAIYGMSMFGIYGPAPKN